MANPLDQVRNSISQALRDLGAGNGEPTESILIREGLYCGRRFRCDGFEAVWFIEENEVKVYDSSGALAVVLSEPGCGNQRRAA